MTFPLSWGRSCICFTYYDRWPQILRMKCIVCSVCMCIRVHDPRLLLIAEYRSTVYGCRILLVVIRIVGKTNMSLSPFAPKNLVSRDRFDRPVPRHHAHFPHSGCTWCVLTGLLSLSAAASIIYDANRPWDSPEFIRSRKCVPTLFTAESSPAQF